MLKIKNIKVLVQVCANGERCLKGAEQDKIAVQRDASIVVGSNGLIQAIGTAQQIKQQYSGHEFEKTIDASGMCLLPGFIDAHTHPVWTGDRVHEFKMKIAGASYMEIHEAGGGIGFTVKHTTEASEEKLEKHLLNRMDRMLSNGTTTAEAKTGYGLLWDTELKMLNVMQRPAVRAHAVELSPTYLAAHSIPKGSTQEAATDDIINHQLPKLAKLREQNEQLCENIDVFVEKGVFERDCGRRILAAGAAQGLRINFHGDEINPMQSGELAEELNATAVSHLEALDDAGIAAMARANTVGVVLPTTAYILHLSPPPVRKMIEANVAVALGSDFNPNAHCLSMPMTMNMACVLFRMTINEALAAATINAAASIGRSKTHGSIEVGKVADFVLVASEAWEHVVYEMVDPPIALVVKNGKIAWKSPTHKVTIS